MDYKIGATVAVVVLVTDDATGQPIAADDPPTFNVYSGGVEILADQPTTARTGEAGYYDGDFDASLANDFAVGMEFDVIGYCEVSAVPKKGSVKTGRVVAALAEDNYSRIGANGAGLTTLATAAELAKVPKSDSNVTWNATALGSITTAATAATPAAASVTAPVTVGTNNDKTGYELTSGERSSIGTAVWATGTRTLSSFGTLVADVWSYATRILTAGTNIVLAKGTGVTGFNDPTADEIAVEVESHLLDEGDSQMLINAIVGAIGNTNIDQAVLVAAIRADLERSGGNLNTVLAKLGTPSNLGSGATLADNLVDIESQTDDIGAAGAGLTALGDTRLANLNATVGSRAVAGDAMTLTSGERSAIGAAVWSVLSATVTTVNSIGKRLLDFVTTLVYTAPPAAAPSASDNATAVWSAAARTLTDKDGFSLTSAYDAAKTAAQEGDAMTLAASEDVYPAILKLVVDGANDADEYTVQWFKNTTPVSSGITVPTLHVIKRADGTDLIATHTMTQIGSTGAYKYDAVDAERVTAGEDVVAEVRATIDGSVRIWREVLGRDAEVPA